MLSHLGLEWVKTRGWVRGKCMKRLGKGCPVPTKTGPKWRQRHVAHRVQSKRYMTRTELANLIEAAVNASEDYSAKLWAKGGHVRVYLTTCGKDIGFFDVRRDGEIDRTALGNGKHGVAATRILDTLKGARGCGKKVYAIFPDGSTIGEEETEDLLNDLDYREEWLDAPEEDGGHDAGGWLNCDASNAEEKAELYNALKKMHKALVNQRRQYWALKLGVEPGLERL